MLFKPSPWPSRFLINPSHISLHKCLFSSLFLASPGEEIKIRESINTNTVNFSPWSWHKNTQKLSSSVCRQSACWRPLGWPLSFQRCCWQTVDRNAERRRCGWKNTSESLYKTKYDTDIKQTTVIITRTIDLDTGWLCLTAVSSALKEKAFFFFSELRALNEAQSLRDLSWRREAVETTAAGVGSVIRLTLVPALLH